METPPGDTSETSPAVTTVDSLKDDNIEDILLRLPSPASLARAALASSRWRGIASSPPFLRRFRERHPSSPVLGLFVSQAADPGQLPVFHPAASVRSDPDLAAVVRWGDFVLTHLEHDPPWRLRDCRNGRLLLCRGESLFVYDPVSHRHVAVRRPRNGPSPVPGTEDLADCLLRGHGEDGAAPAACFRAVTVQRDGQRIRAMECHSCTPSEWRFHPWVDGISNVHTLATQQPMHATAARLIFWRCDRNSSLLLDTSTMTFSTVPLPVPLVVLSTQMLRPPPVYAIGETEAGVCCLVFILGRAMLQMWLLKKNDDNGDSWELEKQSQISELASNRRFSVHMVVAGLALVHCVGSKYSHFVIDLKNLSLKDKFPCHRSMAYPYQMPWPPAGLLATSTCERSTPQTYACGGMSGFAVSLIVTCCRELADVHDLHQDCWPSCHTCQSPYHMKFNEAEL